MNWRQKQYTNFMIVIIMFVFVIIMIIIIWKEEINYFLKNAGVKDTTRFSKNDEELKKNILS